MAEFLPHIVTIAVALIGGFTAWLTQRTSSTAMRKEKKETKRADAEKEAYSRARDFDTDTIERQSQLIGELSEENARYRNLIRELRERVYDLESEDSND